MMGMLGQSEVDILQRTVGSLQMAEEEGTLAEEFVPLLEGMVAVLPPDKTRTYLQEVISEFKRAKEMFDADTSREKTGEVLQILDALVKKLSEAPITLSMVSVPQLLFEIRLTVEANLEGISTMFGINNGSIKVPDAVVEEPSFE